jgi:hypothetical protein
VEYVAAIRTMRKIYKIFVYKSERKRLLGRPRCRSEKLYTRALFN